MSTEVQNKGHYELKVKSIRNSTIVFDFLENTSHFILYHHNENISHNLTKLPNLLDQCTNGPKINKIPSSLHFASHISFTSHIIIHIHPSPKQHRIPAPHLRLTDQSQHSCETSQPIRATHIRPIAGRARRQSRGHGSALLEIRDLIVVNSLWNGVSELIPRFTSYRVSGRNPLGGGQHQLCSWGIDIERKFKCSHDIRRVSSEWGVYAEGHSFFLYTCPSFGVHSLTHSV